MSGQGRGLNYKAQLDTTEALKKARELNKEYTKLSKINVGANGAINSKSFDVKPLSEYQAGILKIKQQQADLARKKSDDAAQEKRLRQEQMALDKASSLARMEALRAERAAIQAKTAIEKAAAQAARSLVTDNGSANYRAAQIASIETLKAARLETERLRQETTRLSAAVEAGRVALQASRTETERKRQAEVAARTALQQGRITQQQHNTTVAAGRAAQVAQNATLAQARIDAQNHRTELARLALQQRQNAIAADNQRRSQVALSGSYREAQQRLTQLGNQIRNVSGGFQSQSPLMQARIREYNQLNERLKAFDATMGNHGRNVGNYRGALKGVGGDLVGLVSGYLSAGAALQYILKTSMEFQRIKTPLTYILGSEGDANAKLSELKKLANELGIEYFALAASYKSFSAAARASNFDLVQSEKIFTSVTKASAVLGLSSEQLQGALTAIQQMISKGNVQAEELRGQLAERLPGAFALSAKAMGVTEKELNKLLETGQVLAKDLLPKLALELDKQYGDKAADGIRGLNAEWQRFITLLQSTAGESSALSRNIFEPILKGAGQVITLLNNSFRGSFTENFRYIFSLFNSTREQLKSVYDLRESFANNKGSLKGAQERDLTGAGLGELKTYYTQVDQTFKKAAKDYETFKKDIASGAKVETATASLAGYARVVEGLAEQRNRIGVEVVKQKKQIATANKDVKEAVLTSVTDIRKEIARLSKMEGSAVIGTDVYNQIETLKGRLAKPKNTTASDYKAAEREAEALGSKLTKLLAESSKASLSADQKEVESVKAKYEEMRKEAQKFYNNPKNSGSKVKVNGQNFSKSQVEGSINAMQDSDLTKITTSKLAAAAVKAKEERDKTYQEAYEAAKTMSQELLEIEATYQKRLAALKGKATQEQLDNLAKIRDNDVSKVASESLTGGSAFTKLFSDLDALTASEIQKLVNEVELQLNDPKLKLNPIDLDAIRKKLIEAKAVIVQDNPFAQVGAAIDAIFKEGAAGAVKSTGQIRLEWTNLATATAGAFQFVDDAVQSCDVLKDVLGEVGATALSSLTQIAQSSIAVYSAIEVAKAAEAAVAVGTAAAITTAEKASVILTIISAALQVVQAIAGIFKGIFAKHDKDIDKSIGKHEDQVKSLESQYNDLGRTINNVVGKAVVKAQQDQISNLKQQQDLIKKMRQAEEDKKKTDSGKIAEYDEKIKQLGQEMIDVQKAMNEALTGTTAKNITDSIIQGFRDGKRSIADFADTFKEMMSGALYAALQTELDPQIAEFYKKFVEAGKDGYTTGEYASLEKEYNDIVQGGLDKVAAIDKLTGKGTTTSSGSSLQGDIKSITTEQAGVLTGTMNGVRLGVIDSNRLLTEGNKVRFDAYSIAKGSFDLTVKIEQHTFRTANNTDKLESLLVSIDKKVGSNANALAANGR